MSVLLGEKRHYSQPLTNPVTLLSILFIFQLLLACGGSSQKVTDAIPPSDPVQAKAKLLFSSGFEAGTFVDPTLILDSEDYRFIRGKDAETNFSWPISILGATQSAVHLIDHDSQRAVDVRIETIIGHDGNATNALYQEENYAFTGATQAPYEILNILQGKTDLYIKYWIKIDSASVTVADPDIWRTFFEYKTKDYAAGSGYRLISFIYTDENGTPYWHWQGDSDSQTPIWEYDNKTVPVPLNEWFMTEFYWHWSNGPDGRSLWKINGQVIADNHGPTTLNSKPIDFILLAQIYGNSNPKYQWIDDIEIWDNLPQ